MEVRDFFKTRVYLIYHGSTETQRSGAATQKAFTTEDTEDTEKP